MCEQIKNQTKKWRARFWWLPFPIIGFGLLLTNIGVILMFIHPIFIILSFLGGGIMFAGFMSWIFMWDVQDN